MSDQDCEERAGGDIIFRVDDLEEPELFHGFIRPLIGAVEAAGCMHI